MALVTMQFEEDTDWIALNSTYPTYYRCKNGILFIYFHSSPRDVPSDGYTLGTIPSQYRTAGIVSQITQNKRGVLVYNGGTTGKVTIHNAKDETLDGEMICMLSYPLP